jgi:hypothetical protein
MFHYASGTCVDRAAMVRQSFWKGQISAYLNSALMEDVAKSAVRPTGMRIAMIVLDTGRIPHFGLACVLD